MRLSREQLLRIADALADDPTIEQIDLDVDNSGKLRVSAVIIQPTLKPIRLTPVSKTAKAETAAAE
jgi:hypothetical protein